MLLCNRGPTHCSEYYVELKKLDSSCINELVVKLNITTFSP